jgi:hypothetical protein
VFGAERLTGALLYRLTHHVHILEMNGDTYRLAHSNVPCFNALMAAFGRRLGGLALDHGGAALGVGDGRSDGDETVGTMQPMARESRLHLLAACCVSAG